MRLGWVCDRRFWQHDPGPLHPERPERLEAIQAAVLAGGLEEQLQPLEFRAATAEQLAAVHEPAYVHLVRMACDEGFSFIGSSETRICRWSYDVAALAAGGCLAACEAVLAGRVRRAFCAVRPPGHHAGVDQAAGFCLFNNVALAAEYLVRHGGLRRIAIVDFDAHHGNGTQQIFESRGDVLYVSLHERPGSLPFPGSGEAEEIGCGPGRGATRNVPLDRGSRWLEYRRALDAHVQPALEDYRPEFLLISAGFDALPWDRVSNLSLPAEAFGWLTRRLLLATAGACQGRAVSVLEGGYDLGELGAAVVAHLRALLDRASPEPAADQLGS